MALCSNCSQDVPDDALLCPNCGHSMIAPRARRFLTGSKTGDGIFGAGLGCVGSVALAWIDGFLASLWTSNGVLVFAVLQIVTLVALVVYYKRRIKAEMVYAMRAALVTFSIVAALSLGVLALCTALFSGFNVR